MINQRNNNLFAFLDWLMLIFNLKSTDLHFLLLLLLWNQINLNSLVNHWKFFCLFSNFFCFLRKFFEQGKLFSIFWILLIHFYRFFRICRTFWRFINFLSSLSSLCSKNIRFFWSSDRVFPWTPLEFYDSNNLSILFLNTCLLKTTTPKFSTFFATFTKRIPTVLYVPA